MPERIYFLSVQVKTLRSNSPSINKKLANMQLFKDVVSSYCAIKMCMDA